jgi:hypothetical protein
MRMVPPVAVGVAATGPLPVAVVVPVVDDPVVVDVPPELDPPPPLQEERQRKAVRATIDTTVLFIATLPVRQL